MVRQRGTATTLKAATIRLEPAGPVAVCPVKGCTGNAPIPWLVYAAPRPSLKNVRLFIRKVPQIG
jgi:hypothetical protein